MKVTVNFGAVRVIVPCGTGDLPVKQLMELAVTRYKKAISKDSDIVIHNLKISSDGGILDPDDKLNDVADDREQIIATFEESILPYLSHNGGDGTSASSVGTESPDIFQNGDIALKPLVHGLETDLDTEKITTGIFPLQVRRGSELALNTLSSGGNNIIVADESLKRWSAVLAIDSGHRKSVNSDDEDDHPPGEREDGSGEEKMSLTQDERREPLGGPMTSPTICSDENSDNSHCESKFEIVKLKNEEGPLGIHVVPASDSYGKDFGLLIQGIEPGGRIDRDGRFHVGDKITEINGLSLKDESFQNTQEIFKDALKAPEISICCLKNENSSTIGGKMPPLHPAQRQETDSSDGMTEDEKGCAIPKNKFLAQTKKTVFGKSPSSAHSSLRKVGRRILIHLKKGSEGLGFSISSKEATPNPHLFIKNILPMGAAVEDGRLKVGDKILEVNRMDVTGKTQSDVVSLLRKVSFGESVELVVSRQETDNSPSPHLPRELPPEKAGDTAAIFPWNKREAFTFNIPLNDTGSAGLGVSVKGKTSTSEDGSVDMGIFVKSVIHGGAASKDGRLRPNDQLLNINGISLLTMTNSQAMETLRRAMIQGEGPHASPNAITLAVSRRIPSFPDNSENVDSSSHERSDSLLSESGDSFYVSNENLLSPITKRKGLTPDTSVSDNSANTVIHVSNTLENSANNCLEYGDRAHQLDREFPSPYLGDNPIIEQLTRWQNFSSQLNQIAVSNGRNSERNVQQTLTLLDTDPEEPIGSTILAQNREVDAYRNKTLVHQKSFSTSAEINFQLPTPIKSKKKDFRKERHKEDALAFSRNGFGRQSMPEKDFYQTRSPVHTPSIKGGYSHSRNQSPLRTFAEKRKFFESSTNYVPREMPVDVGPCETYAKHLPKKAEEPRVRNHRTETGSQAWSNSADSVTSSCHGTRCSQQGSCHSPGCPYHAVPTNDRESSSSRGNTLPLGPTLGMCKSSSLESLQTMVTETQKMELTYNKPGTKPCNESFRAAVDRSYEAPPNSETLEVLQEICENGGGLIARPTLTRPRIRSATVGPTSDAMAKKDGKPVKKKGIFRGLGSMFKFGKSSKKSSTNEASVKVEQQRENDMMQARNAAEEEKQRIQKQYEKLIQTQKMMQLQQLGRQTPDLLNGQGTSTPTWHGYDAVQSPSQGRALTPQSRQQRMHQLRAEHQRRHQQRQGFYPREQQEELYEQHMKDVIDKREIWKRPLPPLPHQTAQSNAGGSQELGEYESPQINASFDIYKEMSKPGSRKGFADPDRYSHYMNFQEIQQQLKRLQSQENYLKNSKISEIMLRLQHEVPCPNEAHTYALKMPKQFRHTLNSPRVRPVSDVFEYETVRNGNLPSKSKSGAKSLPRQSFTSGRQRPPIPAYMIANESVSEPVHNGFYNNNPQSPYRLSKDNFSEKSSKTRATSSKV